MNSRHSRSYFRLRLGTQFDLAINLSLLATRKQQWGAHVEIISPEVRRLLGTDADTLELTGRRSAAELLEDVFLLVDQIRGWLPELRSLITLNGSATAADILARRYGLTPPH